MMEFLLRCFVKSLLWLRYRIYVHGIKEVVSRGREGILFLPNHPALMDPIIVMAMLRKEFHPRALADRDEVDRFFVRRLARGAGVLEIPDLVRHGPGSRDLVAAALKKCIEALKAGDNLVLYPAGHIYTTRNENLRGNSAVETILKELPDVRVVLVRTRGLWGSSFSRASGRIPKVAKNLRRGLLAIILNGLFFTPRRRVTLELYEPEDLPRDADRETLNRFLEDFYNHEAPANTYVPYTIWESGGIRSLPEPLISLEVRDIKSVPETTRRIVTEYLTEATGRQQIGNDDHLGRDLGLDSLARAELIVWLEKEFGFPQGDVDALETVADVLLAACGESVSSRVIELKRVPAKWFAATAGDRRVRLDSEESICDVFLHQAIHSPGKAIIADQASGVRTCREMLTGIFAIKDQIAAMGGENVGIMLPASVAADVTYLATLFAGKTPVMVNWTVGSRNMMHSLDIVSVGSVLTSRILTERLSTQGVDFGELTDRFVFLEDIAGSLSRGQKLRAYLRARLQPAKLLKTRLSPTAVILFTSGSESLPKAVPLTHENLLANIRDVCTDVTIYNRDRLMSILPPFHSFGLTAGMLMPLCAGVPVVHHPNPTEAPMLVKIVEAYKATVLLGTPTFLAGMTRIATDDQMHSLRLAVTGGEKCPDRVYEALRRCCREATILEGYGVTECSPIISVNDEHAPVQGSIGKVLPSLEYAIIDVESSKRVKMGHSGMLIVRGPSVFGGYLNYDGPCPFVEFESKQWYRTGDLVTENADGVLAFSGRLKRFVKLGGEMISLPAVEAVLAQHYAGDEGDGPVLAVEATPSEDHPELVLFTTLDLDRETVNAQIRDAGLSALHNIRRIVHVDEIPLLGTGKTDYRKLKSEL